MGIPLADLLADGPGSKTADALSPFGQFVGTWDVSVRFFDPDGAQSFEGPGVWQFARVLDGRAIQDTLTYGQPGVPTSSSRRIGTTLRSYHRSTGEWHQVWVSPAAELFLVMQARGRRPGRSRRARPFGLGALLRYSLSGARRGCSGP